MKKIIYISVILLLFCAIIGFQTNMIMKYSDKQIATLNDKIDGLKRENREIHTEVQKLKTENQNTVEILESMIDENSRNTKKLVSNSENKILSKIDDIEIYQVVEEEEEPIDVVSLNNVMAEEDYEVQELWDNGLAYYNKGDFHLAFDSFKQLNQIKESDTNIKSYYYASMFYRNPGDTSRYSEIRNNFEELLKQPEINSVNKKVALNVLSDIEIEESNN